MKRVLIVLLTLMFLVSCASFPPGKAKGRKKKLLKPKLKGYNSALIIQSEIPESVTVQM